MQPKISILVRTFKINIELKKNDCILTSHHKEYENNNFWEFLFKLLSPCTVMCSKGRHFWKLEHSLQEFWREASQTLGCLARWHSQVVRKKWNPKLCWILKLWTWQLQNCICSAINCVAFIFLHHFMVIQGDRTITIVCRRQKLLSAITISDISDHSNPATTAERAEQMSYTESHLVAWIQTHYISFIPCVMGLIYQSVGLRSASQLRRLRL